MSPGSSNKSGRDAYERLDGSPSFCQLTKNGIAAFSLIWVGNDLLKSSSPPNRTTFDSVQSFMIDHYDCPRPSFRSLEVGARSAHAFRATVLIKPMTKTNI